MWDKTKIYGYTEEEMEEFMSNGSIPEDNEIMIESNCDELLTREEIKRMFPCQFITLKNVVWEDKDSPNYIKAAVKEYHCTREYASLAKLNGDCEDYRSTYPEYLWGEMLWL